MFLKSKTLWILLFTLIGFSATAQKITVLSPGAYVLTAGPKNLCSANISFTATSGLGKSLSIGALYTYETHNSIHDVQSDIDADCEFKEQNIRDDRSGEVSLTRINEELCKGNRVSLTTSKATITPVEIQIRHEIDGAPAYTCIWKKQEAK